MKKIIMILLSLLMCVSLPVLSFADCENNSSEIDTKPPLMITEDDFYVENVNILKANSLTAYRKANVKYTYEWSKYRRVSDDLKTGARGGSIECNVELKYGVEVSGAIGDLGISTSGIVTADVGYTLNVGKNKTAHMVHRVKYKVEKGKRQLYNIATGKTISSNSYTVKTPMYGEYSLKYK